MVSLLAISKLLPLKNQTIFFSLSLYFLWLTSSTAALENIKWSFLPDIMDPNSLCERLEENKPDQMESAHVNDCLDLAAKDV